MAGAKVSGNKELSWRTSVDITESKKKLEELRKSFIGLNDVAKKNVGVSVDTKPMTAFQQGVIKLKTELNDKNKIWKDLIITEQKAKVLSAESKAETDKLKVAEQDLNNKRRAGRITADEYALAQKRITDAQKLAVATQKEADRQAAEANKRLKEQLALRRQEEAQRERNRKKLQQENSEYYKLNQALNNVRNKSKDLLAEMFKLELQGKKNTDAYRALEARSKSLVSQTQILDRGIKGIDSTLGLHQRHVGDYGRALEGLSPRFAMINGQLAAFGTSITELSEAGGVAAFGASIAAVGKNILKFLISPVGLAITGIAALYALFTSNKDTVINFDDRLLNVGKTTNLLGRDLIDLGNEIINLSRKLKTVSSEKLLEYATVAGQLGVKGKDDILAFSEALAKLEIATNISGEQGGAEIARLLTLTDGGVQNVKAFGDEIVNLGNNFAATEKEILTNAEAISQNTGLYKVGRQEVLAYAVATKAVGLEAEVVGSSFNRTLATFEKAIRTGENIDTLTKATGLSVDQLKAKFKDNASGVFNDFITGLNKVYTSGGSVNEALENIGITAVRDQRVIATLATNGYDVLTRSLETVKNASGSLNAEFDTASGKLKNQSAKFGIAWDNLVLSVENGQGVIGKSAAGIVGFFTDIVDGLTPSTRSMIVNEEQVGKLAARYDELKEKGRLLGGEFKLTKDDQEELRKVTAEIGNILPSVITQFDKYGNALDINRSKIDQMTKAQRELLAAQNEYANKKADEKFDQTSVTLREYQKALSKAISDGKSPELISSGQTNVKLLAGELYNLSKQIRDSGGALTELQQDAINAFEGVEKSVIKTSINTNKVIEDTGSSTARTSDQIKNQIKELEKLRRPLDIASAGYEKYTAQIKKLKEELRVANGANPAGRKEAESALERAKTIGREISENRAASLRNQKESDNAELDSVKDKYEKISAKIDEFYSNGKNKGQPIVISGKKYTKSQATGFVKADKTRDEDLIKAKQSIDATKIQVETQKQLFDEYEQYKTQFGQAEAGKRFAEDLKGYKTYIDYVKSLLPSDSDQSVSANKMRDLINKDLLPTAEKERLKKQEGEYTALLKSTATYEQEATALTESYELKRNELIKKGRLGNAAELDRLHALEMDGLIDQANAKTALARRLSEEVMVLTRSQIKEQLKALTEGFQGRDMPAAVQKLIGDLINRLSIGPDQGNLDELKNREADVIKRIEKESKKTNPNVTALKNELVRLRKEIKGLDSNGNGIANKGLGKFLSDLGDGDKLKGTAAALGFASDAAFTLSEGLGGVDTEAGYTLDTIGQLAGAAADLGASILSGDPAKIIGSAIKAVGTLFSIGKKVREMNEKARKEVEDYYTNAIKGEREYQDLLKERQIQSVRDNKIILQGIRDEIKLRRSQTAAYSKEADEIMAKLQGQNFVASESYKHGTWFRKAQVNKTYGSLQGKSFEQLSQLLAQGKLEGDAKALVERLKELEQKGYDAEKAMADLAKQTSELFTATTSDALTDSLLDMFRNGKTGAQDLADFFKTTMDEAALSIFKNKVLAQAMDSFYKEFDSAAQSGDELTKEEIARLNGLFTSLTGDALKKFEEFQKITGSNLSGSGSGSQPESLKGALTPITSEIAASISGNFKSKAAVRLIGIAPIVFK